MNVNHGHKISSDCLDCLFVVFGRTMSIKTRRASPWMFSCSNALCNCFKPRSRPLSGFQLRAPSVLFRANEPRPRPLPLNRPRKSSFISDLCSGLCVALYISCSFSLRVGYFLKSSPSSVNEGCCGCILGGSLIVVSAVSVMRPAASGF